MESTAGAAPPRNRSRSRHRPSGHSSPAVAPTYGYHNTFHTHAQLPLGNPPSYARAADAQTLRYLDQRTLAEQETARDGLAPPAYDCSVEFEGVVGIKQELSSPFKVASHREWHDAYAILRGTQLSLYRVKTPSFLSKDRTPGPGRLLRTYTLQHAEAGVASDFKKTALTPRSPFAHLMPASSRAKLYESDPSLFETVREHAVRLRLELEQFLLCASTQEDMLSWIEAICAAIDISSPLEDRSEPRYRSLPRRSRRQRALDNAQLGENIENLSTIEAGRRIIAHQEQIIRQYYPHLADTREPEPAPANASSAAADLDAEEFDAEDVRFPTASREQTQFEDDNADGDRPSTNSDPKSAPRVQPSALQILKYRRRCAPVLLASSPRVSDVVFTQGKRVRISVKEHILTEYNSHPPRYDAHNFPKSKRPAKIATNHIPIITPLADQPNQPPNAAARPASPNRATSDDSITCISFGEEIAPTRSESNVDDIASSTPPTPTALTHVKTDGSPELAALGKRRTSEESRENRMSTVALRVWLLKWLKRAEETHIISVILTIIFFELCVKSLADGAWIA